MAAIFQLRRGTTGSKPTLASGEFYMDTDTESLHLGIDSAGDEIVLAKLNDSNAGNFIIAGNLTVVGTITAPIITEINNKFATIEGQSGSWDASSDITSLNAFTSSQNTKNSTLGTLTGSIDNRLNAIENVSNSFVTESETASFFVGATVSSNTITFTKGNGTTADVTVAGGGGSTDISALNSFTASILGTNDWTASINTKFATIEGESGSWGGGGSVPTGTISGSAQITAFGFISSSTIETLGTSIYSTNPATSNFSTTTGIFIGQNAGNGASSANSAVMLGDYAGFGAENAIDSVAIGPSAGLNASGINVSVAIGKLSAANISTNSGHAVFIGDRTGYSAVYAGNAIYIGTEAGREANSSGICVFIGNQAGYQTQNSSYSILIGYQVGKKITGNGIGANNIIIGKNITLENDRKDSINIGGLIFATGSYPTHAGNPYSGSANGKVGINISLPQAALHVSGAAILTNTFTASLSEGYTWVGGADNVTALVATSSFGGGGSTDITLLNQHSASINTYTSSVNNRLNNLELDSASQDSRLDNLESFTSSINTTIKNKLDIESVLSGSAQITAFGFISSSTIQTSGSTIYSTNPATSNFSQTDGVFIGNRAGEDSTAADKSVFIGYYAGWSAPNAYNSIFIGPSAGHNTDGADRSNFIGSSAGDSATNARFSNFMGFAAGYGQSAASYSNIFGFRAGYTNTLGSNNIIIGTNITFENSRKDSINLGGVIFATGSYSNTVSSPFAGAVTDGKVGINISLPQAALHVSGSGIYTGTLTASLQEGYVWVGNGSGITTTVSTSSFGGGGSTDITLLNQHSASINTFTSSINSATSSLSSSIATLSSSFLSASSSFDTRINNLTESVFTHIVTDSAGVFVIDSISKPKLSFTPGATYRFNTSAVGGSHPFKFSTSENGPTQYTTGVTSGSNFIQIEVNYNTPTTLYYYCTNHSNMGNEINTLRIENLVTTSSFNTFTGSANGRLNAIENISSSWVTEAETASFIKNATVNLNTLTFTKGDNTTYPLTIDTGSLPTGVISGSSQITALGFINSVNFYFDPLPSSPQRGTLVISASAGSPTDDSIWVYVNYGGTLQWKEITL